MVRNIGSMFLVVMLSSAGQAGELFLLTRADSAVPHAGVVVRYDNDKWQWLHFGVKDVKRDKKLGLTRQWVAGEIRRNEFPINHLSGFLVSDQTLKKAVSDIESEFAQAKYKWGKGGRDCVTFATAVCVKCGLRTTKDQDYGTPIQMWLTITYLNRRICTIRQPNVDRLKGFVVPWKRPRK